MKKLFLFFAAVCLFFTTTIKAQNDTNEAISNNPIQKLEALPNSLYQFNINNCQIKHLEGLPESLTSLSIAANAIEALAPLPTHLQTLNISYNHIAILEHLPKRLYHFNVSTNQVSDISPLLPFLKKEIPILWDTEGRGLVVGNNPLEVPMPEVVQRGRLAVLKYFQE